MAKYLTDSTNIQINEVSGTQNINLTIIKSALIDMIYPVNSIYLSIDNTNPGDIFGGTWVSFGEGQTLIGVDTNDSDFDTVEETGGTKTHTHTLNDGYTKLTVWGSDNNKLGYSEKSGVSEWTSNYGGYLTYSDNITKNSTFGVNLGGSTDSTSNLPPYITVYMWKRTA